MLHEIAIWPVQRLVDARGALYAAWVIPAMICVAIFAMAYLRFLLAQRAKFKLLLALAGILYVGGALGFEMMSWHYRFPQFVPGDWQSGYDFQYAVLIHIEEVLEMLGVAVFLTSLLHYMADNHLSLSLRVTS
jgi:hypothetical protein